jgi:AcrR family transcriptional regulator
MAPRPKSSAAAESRPAAPAPLPDDTHARLIQAGGLEFARKGFQEASVRAICRVAGANVSAVKYHFGSKEGLYRAVVDEGKGQLCGGVELQPMGEEEVAEEALGRWMRWFLRMLLLGEANHPWLGEILAHEMIRPTAVLDEFVEHMAGPVRAELVRIVWRIAPAASAPRTIELIASAIVGMCASHKHSKNILQRFGTPAPRSVEEIDALAELLCGFVVHGLRELPTAAAKSKAEVGVRGKASGSKGARSGGRR